MEFLSLNFNGNFKFEFKRKFQIIRLTFNLRIIDLLSRNSDYSRLQVTYSLAKTSKMFKQA